MTTLAPPHSTGRWETARHAAADCVDCRWSFGSTDAGQTAAAGRQHAEEHPGHLVYVDHAHHITFRFVNGAGLG